MKQRPGIPYWKVCHSARFLFIFVRSNSKDNYWLNENHINWKSINVLLGIRTWGRRIVGIDDSTELWLPPMSVSLFSSQFYPAFTFWHLKPSPQIYSNPLAPFSFNFRFKFYKFERVLVQLFELILLFALALMFHLEVNSCPVVSF